MRFNETRNPDEYELALSLTQYLPATPKHLSRVAEKLGPELARWGFEQWDLRKRGAAKFARAGEMLFVREALEQATHERVAGYHASQFPAGELVVDATCGIGADLIALAGRGRARGYDLDSERLGCASHNLRVHGLESELVESDSLAADWGAEYAFADPARRVGGQRTFDPSHFSPDPEALAVKMRPLQRGGIKLSPLLFDGYLEALGPRLEFVEYGGECREALVWLGSGVEPGRGAVQAESGEFLPEADLHYSVEAPGEYLIEAGPSVIRAHALGNFGLPGLGDSNGYLTGTAQTSEWLKCYPVLWQGKFDVALLKRELKRLDASTPEIKQRGAKQDLTKLRKQWILDGSQPVAVAIWPVGKSLRAAILALP